MLHRRPLAGVLVFALAVGVAACSGGVEPDDGTDTPDAGTPDAGTPDAGTPDAGTPDAGTPDAGTPDAGTPDAGTPDAGTPDAGTQACTLPPADEFRAYPSLGGGGQYVESDHFLVFGASSSTSNTVLNFMEAAHQCFVEEWCWRSTGLSITKNDGTYYKQNIYSLASMNAGGYMKYDSTAGLAYLQILASQITYPLTTVHEYGHALTLSGKGWVDQGNTGFWWEPVANFVAYTFMTSPYCERARNGHGIKPLTTIIDGMNTISTVYNQSYTVIVNSQNYYQAWPFFTYLTNNPDNYTGLGKMTLPDMWRLHKGNNETPLHELERMAAPVKVQTILGRYWARMAYMDIGLPVGQQDFLKSRGSLSFAANLDSAGSNTYTVKSGRRPQYGGANITPLKVNGNGTVAIQVTNLGNGLSESSFTATLAVRSTSSGSVRYVDLPNGSGQATIASNEEASLVVVNTPTKLYMYNPQSTGSPETTGLNYRVQITGAAPAN